MIKGSMSFKIKESPKQIEKLILQAMAKEMDADFSKTISNIEKQVKRYTPLIFRKSATYKSLLNGDLNPEIGFYPGEGFDSIENILDIIANSIQVTKSKVKLTPNGFKGGLTIKVLISSYSDILNDASATFLTEKGKPLHWLDWLLKQGSMAIVIDYNYGPGKAPGRAGEGVMLKTPGSAWRVPALHSGTPTNNWLTRALRDYEDELIRNYSIIIKRELQKVFR